MIYLDHAASTPLDPHVFYEMKPFIFDNYANPSALYASGVAAKKAIEIARKKIATSLFTDANNIIFTGSATEANNMALFGIAHAHEGQGRHIITTKAEHVAVLAPCTALAEQEFEITYLDVDSTGQIDISELKAAIRPDTIFISIMSANNEIGTIYPIAEIGKYLLRYRQKNNTPYPLLHTDACQAVNYLDMSVERLHVDLLTLNASKIYGPKGIGALYLRKGVTIEPLIYGGRQEKGYRSGTESVANIVGFGAAMHLAQGIKESEVIRLKQLQTYLWTKLQKTFGESIQLNGPELSEKRLVNNINVSVLGYEAEQLVLYLDAKGIAVSTGSACSSDKEASSHVLKAIGLDQSQQDSAIRITLGRSTTKEDLNSFIQALQEVVERLK